MSSNAIRTTVAAFAKHFAYLAEGRAEGEAVLKSIAERVHAITQTGDSLEVKFNEQSSLLVATGAPPAHELTRAPALLQPMFTQHKTVSFKQQNDEVVSLRLIPIAVRDIAVGNEFTALFAGRAEATSPVSCVPNQWIWHPESTAEQPRMIFWDHSRNAGSVFQASAGQVFLHYVAGHLKLPVTGLKREALPARKFDEVRRHVTTLQPTNTPPSMAYGAPAFIPTAEKPERKREVIRGICIAPDASRVGFIRNSDSDPDVSVFQTWDLETGVSASTCEGVPDERRVWTSANFERAFFHSELCELTNPPRLVRQLPHSCVRRAMFSTDGKLFFTHGRGTEIGIWDAKTGDLLGAPVSEEPSGTEVGAVDFERGCLALALSGYRVPTLYEYDPLTGAQMRQTDVAPAHITPITSMSFANNGARLACGDESGLVRVYDTARGQSVGEYSCGLMIEQATLSPDGRWLLIMANAPQADMGTRFSLWNVRTGVMHICGNCYMTTGQWASNSRSFFVANRWATVLRYDVPAGQE